MGWINNRFEKNFLVTTVDYVFNWARKSAIWPMTFGLACCAIEMIAASTSRFDIARFGSEVFRPSPRQSDLMIVSGTVTLKMAPVVKRIYDQMPEPKWVMSMGACSSVGGPFNTYAVLQGVDRIVPVDVYVVGCPPRPENLFYGLLRLQDKIDKMSIAKKPTEVRLREEMVDNFKEQIRIAQANFANPEQLVQPVETPIVGRWQLGSSSCDRNVPRGSKTARQLFCAEYAGTPNIRTLATWRTHAGYCRITTSPDFWCTIPQWSFTSCDTQTQGRSISAIRPRTKSVRSTRWERSSPTMWDVRWLHRRDC